MVFSNMAKVRKKERPTDDLVSGPQRVSKGIDSWRSVVLLLNYILNEGYNSFPMTKWLVVTKRWGKIAITLPLPD